MQPEPCAAPLGWRSPSIGTTSRAVEEEVDDPLAVSAGDDDGCRAEGEYLAGEILLGAALPRPGQGARLGDVRGGDGRQRQ